MSEKPFLGAFTDIPGKEGYQYAPSRPDWKRYPKPGEEQPTLKMPKKPQLEGFVTPDFSATGRQKFEQFVFKKIGGNPFKIDVMDEVNKVNKNLPNLFRHIFRGKVIWEDRGKLNKKQIDYWDDIVKQYRSDIYNKATSNKARMMEEHKWMMGNWESKATEYQTGLKAARTKHEKALAQWTKDRKITPEKPEYKPGQALEKIAAAEKAKASFNKTGKIDAIMAKMFPEYTEGQKLTPKEVGKVNKSYDELISYLKKFTQKQKPEIKDNRRDEAIKQLEKTGHPVTDANVKYIMDQL